MAIAFDVATPLAVGTGDRNFSHNPVGTPRGVLVIVVHEVGTDTVAGVTYGGTSLVEVPLSPLLHTTPETGSIHAFFLGSGVPATDPATVAIDVTDALDYIAACFTVTAGADTIIHDTSTFDSGATTAPSATLTITESAFVAGGLYSGLAAPGSTEVAGTSEVVTGDLGADSGEISRGSTLKTTDFAYGWTQASDDGAVLAVAIVEATPKTVTPDLVALVTATFAPTVSVSENVIVTPGLVALVTALFAPTVTVTEHQTVTPGLVALTLATFAPTVTASDHQSVTPGVVALTLSTFAPTVSVSDNVTVTPDVASLTLATFAPSVAVSDNIIVTPDVVTLNLSAFVPVVTTSDHQTVTPPAASLILSGFEPTVTATDHVTVTPDPASLSLTAFAPDVVLTDHKLVTPDPASLTLTTFAPTVTTTADGNQVVTPDPAVLILSTFAPVTTVGTAARVFAQLAPRARDTFLI